MTRTPNQRREKQAWEKAVDLGLEIQSLIEDDVPEESLDEHSQFFDDVMECTAAVVETIERTRHVTEKQQKALDGWHRGVSAWIK